MKKIFGIAASLILVVVGADAQSEKKPPPPPPPPPKIETVKIVPPKIVNDENLKAPKQKIVDDKLQTGKPPIIKITGKKADEFYERNPSVLEISRKGNILILKMKDGTSEQYDTGKKEEVKSFTEKYGRSPIPPPPPPPKVVVKKTKA